MQALNLLAAAEMKIPYYIYALIATCFIACSSVPTETKESEVVVVEEIIEAPPLQKKYGHLVPKEFPAVANLDSFLANPFDLQAFKKKKGSSNSGGVKTSYLYRPPFKGLYYSFFLFANSIGHRGGRIHRFPLGLEVTTYRPFGKYENDYLDPSEVLIAVSGTHNDVDLPELAFAGYDTLDIQRRLGAPHFRKSNCFVYTSGNFALILSIENGMVDWLRYAHLTGPLTVESEYDGLYRDI